jgi:hypothetical protein
MVRRVGSVIVIYIKMAPPTRVCSEGGEVLCVVVEGGRVGVVVVIHVVTWPRVVVERGSGGCDVVAVV